MKVMDKSAILALIMIKKILKLMFCTQTQSYGPPAGGESLEERRMREVIIFNWYNPKDGENRLQCENEAKADQILISRSFLKILKIIEENMTQAREKAEREKKLREIEEMRRRVSRF